MPALQGTQSLGEKVCEEPEVRKSLTEVLRSRGAARVYLFAMCLMFSIPTAAQTGGGRSSRASAAEHSEHRSIRGSGRTTPAFGR